MQRNPKEAEKRRCFNVSGYPKWEHHAIIALALDVLGTETLTNCLFSE